MEENKTLVIKIDPWSIIKISLLFLFVFFLYLIKDIILIFLTATILSFIFSPFVDFLEKKGFLRFVATLIVYLIILLIFIGIIIPIVPIFIKELNFLIEKIPSYYESLLSYLSKPQHGWSKIIRDLFSKWPTKSGLVSFEIFSILGGFLGSIFVFITTLIVAFYLTAQKDFLKKALIFFFPTNYKENISKLYELIQKDIGNWGRGLLFLCFFVGFLDYLGLKILNVNFALSLAILGGLLEVIPWFGPWFAGFLAFFIALVQSPIKALMVAILYLAVQQIENNLVVPQVMSKVTGLNPLIVILVLLIGAKLGGPIGIILATPTVTIISLIIKEYLKIKQKIYNFFNN
jgi:predicted PurR-regulated permease PerM